MIIAKTPEGIAQAGERILTEVLACRSLEEIQKYSRIVEHEDGTKGFFFDETLLMTITYEDSVFKLIQEFPK